MKPVKQLQPAVLVLLQTKQENPSLPSVEGARLGQQSCYLRPLNGLGILFKEILVLKPDRWAREQSACSDVGRSWCWLGMSLQERSSAAGRWKQLMLRPGGFAIAPALPSWALWQSNKDDPAAPLRPVRTALPTWPGSSPRRRSAGCTWTSSARRWTPGCNRGPARGRADLQFVREPQRSGQPGHRAAQPRRPPPPPARPPPPPPAVAEGRGFLPYWK